MIWQHIDAHALGHFANGVNPLLVVLLLGAIVWRRKNDAQFAAGRFLLCALLALGAAFVLGRINAALKLWPGFPGDPGRYEFPSGHTCFAVAVATSLYLINRRWLLFVVPLLIAYGLLIVSPPLRYHSWLDVIGAWLLMPPLTLLCHRTGAGTSRDSQSVTMSSEAAE